jgi:AbrB family looped-hinge helix DNA binding protein
MARQKGGTCGCPGDAGDARIRVVSMVSVDGRGQMVLPKDLRDLAGIRAGDRLAVVAWEQGGKVCCISLIAVEELGKMAKELLGPMMRTLASKEG